MPLDRPFARRVRESKVRVDDGRRVDADFPASSVRVNRRRVDADVAHLNYRRRRQLPPAIVNHIYDALPEPSRAAATVDVCVEINQCVGCSFPGDGVAALVPSSGEQPTSQRHRAGVASMAWRSTRRFRRTRRKFDFHTGQRLRRTGRWCAALPRGRDHEVAVHRGRAVPRRRPRGGLHRRAHPRL